MESRSLGVLVRLVCVLQHVHGDFCARPGPGGHIPGLQKEKTHFWRHGYHVVRGLFSASEMEVLKQVVHGGRVPINKTIEVVKGRKAAGEHPSFRTILGWTNGNISDIFSKVSRSSRILDRLACYYEEDVYDFHTKLTMKLPGFPGFRPHQDHWYWKTNGAMLPLTGAVFVAVDETTEANGCLQVVPSSHLLGTLEHGNWGGGESDLGILPHEYYKLMNLSYTTVPLPQKPGDAIFFHGDTIHLSNDNLSPGNRLAIIVTMNTASNQLDPLLNVVGYQCYSSPIPRVHEPITAADTQLPMPDFSYKDWGCSDPKAAAVAHRLVWRKITQADGTESLELVTPHRHKNLT